jgi:hypothetical protein
LSYKLYLDEETLEEEKVNKWERVKVVTEAQVNKKFMKEVFYSSQPKSDAIYVKSEKKYYQGDIWMNQDLCLLMYFVKNQPIHLQPRVAIKSWISYLQRKKAFLGGLDEMHLWGANAGAKYGTY